MLPLKLLSLNCEGHRHLAERIFPFIAREAPDVVQLQEIFAVDIPDIEHQTGMRMVQFIPMCNVVSTSRHVSHAFGAWGICQLSRLPVHQYKSFTYFDANHDPSTLPIFMEHDNPNNMHRVVALMRVEKDHTPFTLGTTHLTWTTHGESTPEQLRDLDAMLEGLAPYQDMILTGDFNAPRGNPTFSKLAETYRDWIPAHYKTSIDGSMHKAGNIELMVDGLFTSDHYRCHQVKLVDGVSDHMGILAEIDREK